MSSKSQMRRFTRYLNHSFFIGADPLLKTKHSQFINSTSGEKEESVFDRLEKDKNVRKEQQKLQDLSKALAEESQQKSSEESMVSDKDFFFQDEEPSLSFPAFPTAANKPLPNIGTKK